MAVIRIRVTSEGPTAADLLGQILDDLHEALLAAMTLLARDGVRYWRQRTPKITGTLRRSEVATVTADRADLRYGVNFHLRGRGASYYHLVANTRRNRHLKGLRVVDLWLDRNIDKYIDRGLTAAGF